MSVTAHTRDFAAGPPAPLASHPVVSEPPLEACLLLAQAVAQHGTKDWTVIAKLLDQSPYWPAEAGRMTGQVRAPTTSSTLFRTDRHLSARRQGYEAAFEELMRERGLDPYEPPAVSHATRPALH